MLYGNKGYGEGGYGGTMTKEATVSVTLEEEGKMTVTVTDGNGNAISDATVELSGTQSETGTTDDNGDAVFQPIQIGDYDVSITKEGYFSETKSVSSGDFS